MAMPNIDDVARQVVELHFHPEDGSPYWLDRAGRLDQDPLLSVKNFEDFRRIVGFRDEEDQRHFEVVTRTEPVEQFVPASVLRNERWFWPTQTGGTTGDTKNEGNSEATALYIQNIWDQVRPIVRHRKIGLVYTTARLLEMFLKYLDPADFRGVRPATLFRTG